MYESKHQAADDGECPDSIIARVNHTKQLSRCRFTYAANVIVVIQLVGPVAPGPIYGYRSQRFYDRSKDGNTKNTKCCKEIAHRGCSDESWPCIMKNSNTAIPLSLDLTPCFRPRYATGTGLDAKSALPDEPRYRCSAHVLSSLSQSRESKAIVRPSDGTVTNVAAAFVTRVG